MDAVIVSVEADLSRLYKFYFPKLQTQYSYKKYVYFAYNKPLLGSVLLQAEKLSQSLVADCGLEDVINES